MLSCWWCGAWGPVASTEASWDPKVSRRRRQERGENAEGSEGGREAVVRMVEVSWRAAWQ